MRARQASVMRWPTPFLLQRKKKKKAKKKKKKEIIDFVIICHEKSKKKKVSMKPLSLSLDVPFSTLFKSAVCSFVNDLFEMNTIIIDRSKERERARERKRNERNKKHSSLVACIDMLLKCSNAILRA